MTRTIATSVGIGALVVIALLALRPRKHGPVPAETASAGPPTIAKRSVTAARAFVQTALPSLPRDTPATKEEYHPRPANEWQGMLVEREGQSECRRGHVCGLALACLQGRCGPCRSDRECETGEVCVLDHCLLQANVRCRSAAQCGQGLCILSGLSDDPRGNKEMRSLCDVDYVPPPEAAKPTPSTALPAAPRQPSLDEELLRELDR